MKKRLLFGLMMFVSVYLPLDAATIRVPQDHPTIQAGIDAAVSGDTVLVDDGVYTGDGNVDLETENKNITLKSVNGAAATVIDGFGLAPGLKLAGSSVTVEGLTIERTTGYAIYVIIESHATIQKCTLTGNTVAILCAGANTSAVITDCTFTGTSTAIQCGGPSQLPIEIINCTFLQRGGIEYEAIGSLNIINCLFATGEGGQLGAIAFRPTSDDASLNIINSTITGNFAIKGGAIYVRAGFVELLNTILWNNIAAEGNEIYFETPVGSATFTFCDIRGGQAAFGGNPPPIVYENNIDADPLFVDADNGDYRLLSGSPAIDAGTFEGAPETDIDGNLRPLGNGVDMGAYEQIGVVQVRRPTIDITAIPNPASNGQPLRVDVAIDNPNSGFGAKLRLYRVLETTVAPYLNQWMFLPNGVTNRTIFESSRFFSRSSLTAFIATLSTPRTERLLALDVEIVAVEGVPVAGDRALLHQTINRFTNPLRHASAAPSRPMPAGKLTTTWGEMKAAR